MKTPKSTGQGSRAGRGRERESLYRLVAIVTSVFAGDRCWLQMGRQGQSGLVCWPSAIWPDEEEQDGDDDNRSIMQLI